MSTNTGNKAIIDSNDKDIIKIIKNITGEERISLLNQIRHDLTKSDIDILLGRKEALDGFKTHLQDEDWDEYAWQTFFTQNEWIFGYGLNYQFLNLLKEQPDYGGRNFSGKGSQRGDFLMRTNAYSQFTVLVEIKTPATPLMSYTNKKPRDVVSPRNDVWLLSSKLISAVSQIQVNARTWGIDSQKAENIRQLEEQSIFTVEPKGLLIIGNTKELNEDESIISCFESFRRNLKNPEIITFDELFERAKFIVGSNLHNQPTRDVDDEVDDLPF